MSRLFSIPQLEAAEIGGDILWDSIVSIEYLGYEHVYDIEVDGTHNFIGNGIFAHNTYIGGKIKVSMQSFEIPEGHPGYASDLQINGRSLEEEDLRNLQKKIEQAISYGETPFIVELNGKKIIFHILRDKRFGNRALVVDDEYLASFEYNGSFSKQVQRFMNRYYKDLEIDGVRVEELPGYLIFCILDKSPHQAEDCTGNHFIFTNRALTEWEDLKERRVLLRTTRMHETRHETNPGINIEFVQSEFDAEFLRRITKHGYDLIQKLIDKNLIRSNKHTQRLLRHLTPRRRQRHEQGVSALKSAIIAADASERDF